MTRRIIVVVAALVLSATAGTTRAADSVTLPGTRYSIALPGSPTCDPESSKLPMGVEFPAQCSAEVDGVKYTFDYMALPYEVPIEQAEGGMFGAAMGFAMAMDGKLAKKTMGTVAGFPFMDFAVKAKGGRIVAYARYVFVESHLVRAMISTEGKRLAPDSVEEVLGSLTIAPKE